MAGRKEKTFLKKLDFCSSAEGDVLEVLHDLLLIKRDTATTSNHQF